MRELKFRVWQPTNNYVYFGLSKGNSFAFKSTPCIEQYTGLKDKNGNEVYEGDILGRIEAFTNAIVEKMQVVWIEQYASFGFRKIVGGGYGGERALDEGDERTIETSAIIIGNIHENPELVEQEG